MYARFEKRWSVSELCASWGALRHKTGMEGLAAPKVRGGLEESENWLCSSVALRWSASTQALQQLHAVLRVDARSILLHFASGCMLLFRPVQPFALPSASAFVSLGQVCCRS